MRTVTESAWLCAFLLGMTIWINLINFIKTMLFEKACRHASRLTLSLFKKITAEATVVDFWLLYRIGSISWREYDFTGLARHNFYYAACAIHLTFFNFSIFICCRLFILPQFFHTLYCWFFWSEEQLFLEPTMVSSFILDHNQSFQRYRMRK